MQKWPLRLWHAELAEGAGRVGRDNGLSRERPHDDDVDDSGAGGIGLALLVVSGRTVTSTAVILMANPKGFVNDRLIGCCTPGENRPVTTPLIVNWPLCGCEPPAMGPCDPWPVCVAEPWPGCAGPVLGGAGGVACAGWPGCCAPVCDDDP